jgi:hypothetical protein
MKRRDGLRDPQGRPKSASLKTARNLLDDAIERGEVFIGWAGAVLIPGAGVLICQA